jgi:electron transfer flavoprotein alpha subunit
VKILARFIEEKRPRILLFGHTFQGAELGPRLAFRLNRGIATDCVDLSVEPDTNKLLRTKPIYGGMAMAIFTSEDFPQMATVRPKALPPAERRTCSQGNSVPFNLDFGGGSPRIRFLERVTEEVAGIKLEDADVIVSGGRGIQGKEGFRELDGLAKLLKGTVGASRVACDSGWVPSTLQVGLTGKIVAPKLYIAVGISGASQHMTGCSRSQCIVAINKDPAAPIFKQAHFGVVGDWKVVLPAFMEKLKSLG